MLIDGCGVLVRASASSILANQKQVALSYKWHNKNLVWRLFNLKDRAFFRIAKIVQIQIIIGNVQMIHLAKSETDVVAKSMYLYNVTCKKSKTVAINYS